MSTVSSSSMIILKILSGLQAGVEVSLPDGEYRLGSSPDDDIQIIDVTLKAGHVRIRLKGSKIEVAGGSGTLAARSGVSMSAGAEFHEIEPLDVLTAGTTRFALGLSSANWATIGEAEEAEAPRAPAARREPKRRPEEARGWFASRAFAGLTAAVVVGGVALAIAQTTGGGDNTGDAAPRNELAAIQEIVASKPFARAVKVRQEVDGAIFVDGYVENVVERRALNTAIEQSGIPARSRIRVLEALRGEVASLIEARQLPVQFNLSDAGVLTLTGVVLDSAKADEFSNLLREDVIGLAEVRSEIKTAATLLEDVAGLAKMSKIDPYVLLRLDGELIEANGVLPAEKIDAWVGFLQAYADRFSGSIALRSFVQLQDATGATTPAPTGPGISIGPSASLDGTIPLDVERLKNGDFRLDDVFVGPAPETSRLTRTGTTGAPGTTEPGPRLVADATDLTQSGTASDAPQNLLETLLASPAEETPATPPPEAATGASTEATAPANTQSAPAANTTTAETAPANSNNSSTPTSGSDTVAATTDAPASVPTAVPAERAATVGGAAVARASAKEAGEMESMAERLIGQLKELGKSDSSQGGDDEQAAETASAKLPGGAGLRETVDRYEPLFVRPGGDAAREGECWPGSTLTGDRLAHVLFWLDLLSLDSRTSIKAFKGDTQLMLLEAAFNPGKTRACAERIFGAAAPDSVYLDEVARNPDFVRFIVRDLPPFALPVTGASIGDDSRYVQTSDGRKLFEGAAPSSASRLAAVTELGVVLQMKDGLATYVFDDSMSWVIR